MKRLRLSYISFGFLLVGMFLSWNVKAQQKSSAKTEIIFNNKDFKEVQVAAKASHKKYLSTLMLPGTYRVRSFKRRRSKMRRPQLISTKASSISVSMLKKVMGLILQKNGR